MDSNEQRLTELFKEIVKFKFNADHSTITDVVAEVYKLSAEYQTDELQQLTKVMIDFESDLSKGNTRKDEQCFRYHRARIISKIEPLL